MALIFPDRLPNEVLNDKFRSSEVKIYNQLKKLDDDFVVFYSVAYQTKTNYDFVSDGEIDFLIFNIRKGFLCLEIKGGVIEHDPISQLWYTSNRYGSKKRIKNPFEQSKTNHYALRSKLYTSKLTKGSNYRTCYGVVFPSCNIDNENNSISYDRSIFIDRNDLQTNSLQKLINQMYFYWHPKQLSRTYNVKPIINLFSYEWKFKSPLIDYINDVTAKQSQLTEQQFLLLNFLNRHRKAKISGCAGSGKTFLAAEKARRLSLEGEKVLVLCWSKQLSHWLKIKLKDVEVDVNTVYEFVESLKKFENEYTAVIIDEGQDIPQNHWEYIELIVDVMYPQ